MAVRGVVYSHFHSSSTTSTHGLVHVSLAPAVSLYAAMASVGFGAILNTTLVTSPVAPIAGSTPVIANPVTAPAPEPATCASTVFDAVNAYAPTPITPASTNASRPAIFRLRLAKVRLP